MAELTHEQAAVLINVPDMPIYAVCGPSTIGFNEPPHQIYSNWSYYLTPGAPLTAQQAAICLAMGVVVEAQYADGEWHRITLFSFDDFEPLCAFRVPENGE